MSSTKLEKLQFRHPNERDALTRLQSLLCDGRTYRLTLDQVADMVDANSRDELAMILGELAAAQLLDFGFQVRSPVTKQPLKEFKTLAEIPRTIRDKTTDTDFIVDVEDVRPIYSFRSRSSHDATRA